MSILSHFPSDSGGNIDITNLCPEIVCAGNHLRDIVEVDGEAYVRIGFYSVTTEMYGEIFRCEKAVLVDKLVLIGPGGYGARASDSNYTGDGGQAGEYVEYNNVSLFGQYSVYASLESTSLKKFEGSACRLVYQAAKGQDGRGDGYMYSSSAISGIPGKDGYMLDLLSYTVTLDPVFCTTTGAGIGAGGPGGSLHEDGSVCNEYRQGLLGGVFLYVKL